MKNIIISLLLIVCSNIIYSQYNWLKILNADTCGIDGFKHFTVSYDSKKIIFVRFAIPNQPVHSSQALYFSWSRLNKNLNTWIINPYNNFLYSFPFYCPWPNVMAWRYYKVDNFALSGIDANLILQTRDVPPCGTGIQEPRQDTRITYNSGSNFVTYSQFGNDFLGNLCGGFDIDFTDDAIMYFCYRVGGSEKFVYKTTNRGSNWVIVDTVPSVQSYGTLKINPMRRNEIFIRANSSMLKSSNSGVNFINVGGASFPELIFDRVDSSIFGFNQNQIYKSTNHGSNWNIISAITSANIRSMEINPDNHNILYAGNDSGLYRSTNAGLNWNLYNNSFYPSRRVIGISKDYSSLDTLYVSTSDAVYKVWGGFLSVGINVISNEIPKRYSLYQNYPNPFNPTAHIRFEIPKKGFVRLIIYDVLGNEIEALVRSELSPGVYSADWDAKIFPSGVYFYKLETVDFTDTKKMVLIK